MVPIHLVTSLTMTSILQPLAADLHYGSELTMFTNFGDLSRVDFSHFFSFSDDEELSSESQDPITEDFRAEVEAEPLHKTDAGPTLMVGGMTVAQSPEAIVQEFAANATEAGGEAAPTPVPGAEV